MIPLQLLVTGILNETKSLLVTKKVTSYVAEPLLSGLFMYQTGFTWIYFILWLGKTNKAEFLLSRRYTPHIKPAQNNVQQSINMYNCRKLLLTASHCIFCGLCLLAWDIGMERLPPPLISDSIEAGYLADILLSSSWWVWHSISTATLSVALVAASLVLLTRVMSSGRGRLQKGPNTPWHVPRAL